MPRAKSLLVLTTLVCLGYLTAETARAASQQERRGRRDGRGPTHLQQSRHASNSTRIPVGMGSISGSTGADGPFNPQSDVTIDLATQGTYDAVNWRVVFNYTSIDIPSGVTVTFTNHPSRAPVVWLATQAVVIAGGVNVRGQFGNGLGSGNAYAEPGPGGFRGGNWTYSAPEGSSGYGFGGGIKTPGFNENSSSGGSHASFGGGNSGRIYGSPSGLPLIGGSGGGIFGRTNPLEGRNGAGGGGGAILIASDVSISISGAITAEGGGSNTEGAGAGGLIRLISNDVSVESNGDLFARGGSGNRNGGDGRIRIEATNITMTGGASPNPTFASAPGPVLPPNSPRLWVVSVDNGMQNAPVSMDPRADFVPTMADATLNMAGPATVFIEATDVPAGTVCEVRVTPTKGNLRDINGNSFPTQYFDSTPLQPSMMDPSILEATAAIELPVGVAAIQLRAIL